MKKLYTFIFSLVIAANISASAQDDKPTFFITELTAPSSDEGIVYTGSQQNASIEISLRNVTQQTWPGTFNPACFNQSFSEYPYITLANANTANSSSDNSYILIKNTGEANILKIQFVAGSAENASMVTCGASIDGIDYLGDYVRVESGQSVATGYTFPAPVGGEMVNVCSSNYTYVVPDEIEDIWGGGQPYDDFTKRAKYFRLNWGTDFAGLAGVKGSALNLFAVIIYTDAKTTGVENETNKDSDFNIYKQENNLVLSEEANVEIYTITGVKVLQAQNSNKIDISALNKGIYIAKAKTNTGQIIVKKIVI